jgi:hypothetical protein
MSPGRSSCACRGASSVRVGANLGRSGNLRADSAERTAPRTTKKSACAQAVHETCGKKQIDVEFSTTNLQNSSLLIKKNSHPLTVWIKILISIEKQQLICYHYITFVVDMYVFRTDLSTCC